MKFIVSLIVAVGVSMSFADTADASRPVPGYHYKDECRNIPGKQPIYMVAGSGPYRKNEATVRPNDCYRIVKPGK